MKLVCKICGKEIEKDKEQYTIREFLKHLKNKHNIDKEDYIVKYELNGKHPQCACGCGNPVKIAKGWNVWKKYYKDHKNHMKNSDEIKNKISKAALKRKLSGYYDKIMTDEEINNSFDDFYNGKLTLSEISKKYNHDKRTIKRIWLAKNKINEREYEKIAYRNNFSIGANKRFKKYNENLKYYEEIYDFILANKFKYTINEINEIFGKKMTQTTLLNHLIKLFGEDISTYLVYGYKSKEELFFLNILSFYFGKSNVKYGFNVGGKIFDCLLFNKILLEYDGKYYHNNELSKKNDLEKNKIAHDNGYILIRCNEKSVKNIDFLKKNRRMEKYEFIEITEYEEIYDECVVYDLTIENSHSYTANGFVVHNCGCLSSSNTGIHMPMATLIDETVEVKKSLENKRFNGEYKKLPKIIADGGIRNYRDIIKALALGADYVMIGSVFAKMLESAAPKTANSDEWSKLPLNTELEELTDFRLENTGWRAKYNGKEIYLGDIKATFYGMASKEGQIALSGAKTKTSEGIKKTLPVLYTMHGWTTNFMDYLRSAMSYLGVKNLNGFRDYANVIINSQNAVSAVNK